MSDIISYIKSVKAVRDRTRLLLEHPSHLQHFDLHLDKVDEVVNMILMLMVRDYPTPADIPPHTRGRHFEVSAQKGIPRIPRVQRLIESWTSGSFPVSKLEVTKRVLDLYVVSVLLDAGAGNRWVYHPEDEPKDVYYNRSEGLALASLDMFKAGCFSSEPSEKPFRVDSTQLKELSFDVFLKAFQVDDETNPLVGAEGRFQLLKRLGSVLESFPEYFKSGTAGDGQIARPGHLVDYLLIHPSTRKEGESTIVQLDTLWEVVIKGFAGIWPPTRTNLDGESLGDVWPSQALAQIVQSPQCAEADKTLGQANHFVAFHKLSQWLTYSLMEPLSSLMGIEFEGVEQMTGLAEYRNGGLFVDMQVLTLKPEEVAKNPKMLEKYNVYDDLVVEWRALTVALLDTVAERIRKRLGLSEKELPLVKVLEAGTWKAGREIAAKLRPETRGPPIEIKSDGTVF